jgi:N-alpha-acetyltransferase 30
MDAAHVAKLPGELRYIQYEHGLEEKYLPAIRSLISRDLSEPYSIYVYRYFLYQWGHLCFMVCNLLNLLFLSQPRPRPHKDAIGSRS